MNKNHALTAGNMLAMLPQVLREDANIYALASAAAEALMSRCDEIDRIRIYSRIDELEEELLDILAYDFHIDWYDYSHPVEIKRKVIKDSAKVHQKLGTKYAVETALGAVFPGTKIEEWFEYGGAPYTFRITIDTTSTGATSEQQEEVLKRVRFYKNLRSHMEAVNYRIEREATVYAAGALSVGIHMDIYPRPVCFEEELRAPYAAFAMFGQEIKVLPLEGGLINPGPGNASVERRA